MSPDPKWDWTKLIIFAIIAFSGGSLGYTMRSLDRNEKPSVWRVILEGASAVFFAVITGAICIENNVSIGYMSATIGLTSWIGSRATFLIVRSIAYKKIGITPEAKNDNEPPSS